MAVVVEAELNLFDPVRADSVVVSQPAPRVRIALGMALVLLVPQLMPKEWSMQLMSTAKGYFCLGKEGDWIWDWS